MSTHVSVKFYLTGPLKGKTIQLGSLPYPFTNGVMELRGSPGDIALHAQFLERNWEAYPEGHEKLKEAANGKRNIPEDSQPDPQPSVPSGVSPDGEGSEAGESESVEGAGPTEGEAGETGGVADGDGQPAELNQKLQRAIFTLDPENDDHWTKDGQPAMSAVEKLYGSSAITRADVRAAAPEFSREKARETPTEE